MILPVVFMTGLALALSISLVLAKAFLIVFEDPRLKQLEEMLPNTNCGACGTPGCGAFAMELVAGTVLPGGCTQSSTEATISIAELLQVDAGIQEKRVARLACQGGGNVARQRATYQGFYSCVSANLVAGGGKGCAWGCLGMGDCEVACRFDALHLDSVGLPQVDPEKCTACGDCVSACPKNLFDLIPLSKPLFIACKNLQEGEEAETNCAVACTGCGLCAADGPTNLISIHKNLAVLDLNMTQDEITNHRAIERCPTGAIGIWGDQEKFIKGKKAKKILKHSYLEVG